MKETRITEKIIYVEPDSMARFSSCAGLMVHSKKKLFIDMNLGESDTRLMLEQFPPDAAVITHFHLDHSAWINQAETAGVTVFVPAAEASFLRSLDHLVTHTAGPLGFGEEWRVFVENTLGFKPLNHFSAYDQKTVFTEFAPEMVVMERRVIHRAIPRFIFRMTGSFFQATWDLTGSGRGTDGRIATSGIWSHPCFDWTG